jgi:general secretion pathway protein A
MYESYWGFQGRPFESHSDERTYFPSELHNAAQLKLHYAIETRKAVALLCGEPGTGKSMILDSVLQNLPAFVSPTVRVVYPAMPPEQLLRYIARQMAPHDSADIVGGIGQSIETLERMLRHNVGENQHALIVLDEAHLLESYGSLEPLRLLLNLAAELTDSESAVTLVLAGSNNLLAHIARHSALEDRVSVRCVLERFSHDETAEYIQHRLHAVGSKKANEFTAEAIERIQETTLGIPRRINRLCDLGLMVGFAQELPHVDANTIENAHSELSIRSQAA